MSNEILILEASIRHLEAVKLTLEWVKEMGARLPALEAAIKSGATQGTSPFEDVRQFKAAVAALGYFRPEEAPCYNVEKRLGEMRTLLARLKMIHTPPKYTARETVKVGTRDNWRVW